MSTSKINAYPDLATTMAISGEIANSVDEVLDRIDRFFAAPAGEPVTSSLASISVTLNFTGMRVASIAADLATKVAGRLESAGIIPSQQERTALSGALKTLREYLLAAASGHVKPGVVLHPPILDLAEHLPGTTAPTRAELFLPIWPQYHEQGQRGSDEYEATVGAYREELSRTIEMHRAEPTLTSLQNIRAPLVTIETKLPPLQIRHLVSLSIAAIDSLVSAETIADEISEAFSTVANIVVAETTESLNVPDNTVSVLLEAVSRNPNATERTRHFSQVYDLERLAMGSAVTTEQLGAALEACSGARYAWEAVAADLARAEALKDTSVSLARIANVLDNAILRILCLSFATLVDGITSGSLPDLGVPGEMDGEPTGKDAMREEIAVFGASLLLAIQEQVTLLESGRSVDRELVDYYKQAVRDVLSGSSLTLPRPSNARALVLSDVMEQAAATLKALETTVDLAFQGDAGEEKLAEINHDFLLVCCALEFMQLDRAANAARTIHGLTMDALRRAQSEDTSSDQERLASPVMHLTSYLDVAAINPRNADLLLLELEKELSESTDQSEATESVANEFDVCSDPDLGTIFFDEARSVLSSIIDPGVTALRRDVTNRDALVDVRRGFHTLKGSARMVGLINLAKIAEAVEYLLNIVRDSRNVVISGDMLDWIENASATIAQCVDKLAQGRPVPIDPQGFAQESEKFRKSGSARFTHQDNVRTTSLADDEAAAEEGTEPASTTYALSPQNEVAQTENAIAEEAPLGMAETGTLVSMPELMLTLDSDPADLSASAHIPATDSAAQPSSDLSTRQSAELGTDVNTASPGAPHDQSIGFADDVSLTLDESSTREEANASLLEDVQPSLSRTPGQGIGDALAMAEVGETIDTISSTTMVTNEATSATSLAFADDTTTLTETTDFRSLESQQNVVLESRTFAPSAIEDEPVAMHPAVPDAHGKVVDEIMVEDPTPLSTDLESASGSLASKVEHEVTAPFAPAQHDRSDDPEPAEEHIQVGSISIAKILHETLVHEASDYASAMTEKLADLVEGRTRHIDFEFYRLAHSLVGMGRTTRFGALTEVASVLEEWSNLNQGNSILVSKTSATTLTEAMRHLSWTIQSISEMVEPQADKWIIDNMRTLISMNRQFVLPKEEQGNGDRAERQTASPTGRPDTSTAKSPTTQTTAPAPVKKSARKATTQIDGRSAVKAVTPSDPRKQVQRPQGTNAVPGKSGPRPSPPGSPRPAPLRTYKKAPAKSDTLAGALALMIGRAARRLWNMFSGK